MSTAGTMPSSTRGLVQLTTVEDAIQRRLEQERARLEREAGIQQHRVEHFAKPLERPFIKAERPYTTVLFGGLTWKHEKLVQGALESLGYKCKPIPTPNVAAFQLGKEYGNNGQCNPTYFTVGNLVQYLQGLEEQGISKKEIADNYVFVTAGACGPCRFGMYEAEYRLALRNSGFGDFRVILFQQEGGLNQAQFEAGLEMNLDFFLGILNGFNMGDLLNEVAYLIRPYEINSGETDQVLEEAVEHMYQVMRRKKPWTLDGKFGKRLADSTNTTATLNYLGKFLNQICGEEYISELRAIRDRFDQIPVDRTRQKPIVKCIGEFWAQTTEGDGNFNMFRFLEREGAQVVVEPIATWVNYLIHQAVQSLRDRKGLEEGVISPPLWRVDQHARIEMKYRKRLTALKLAEMIFKREFHRVKDALGGIAHGLTDQYELQRVAHPYYNSRASGGEGHLEVAKNIYYSHKDLCHMVLSLKPFGCMPSTQSDGAQSAVMSHYRDMIYLPIETSGEGEINAHSRVQMALGEAKAKAKDEFHTVLAKTGYTLEEIRSYVDRHRELKRPMYQVPHTKGVIGTAANFVIHVADRMRKEQARATVN